jgi:hypothetical protein
MNSVSLTPTHKKLAAIVGGTIALISLVLLLDGSGGRSGSFGGDALASHASDFDVDVCSFLTAEDIEAATGIANMTGHDEGRNSATGARVCKFDTGNGRLPTLTIWAHPNDAPDLPAGEAGSPSYVEFARRNYRGVDLPGVGDDAFVAGGSVYVQKGDVTVEITTLVMKGYLPGKIEGEPLHELARAAADRMSPPTS